MVWVESGRQNAARFTLLPLQAVIHVEFDGMSCHSQASDVLQLQVDVGINQVIAKDATGLQEVAIAVERA